MRYGPAIALLLCAQAVLLVSRARWGMQGIHAARVSGQTFLSRCRERRFLETLLFFAALGAFTGWLFFTHSLRPTAAGLTSAGVSWEDQSGHSMYASSFLYSENLTALENPYFSGGPLAYPFLGNFLAASLAQLGASLSQAFWLSGWYAAMTFLLVAWVVIRDWTGTARRASLAIVLLLCSGGFGFIDFTAGLLNGKTWAEMILKHDYANAWELKLHYHNLLTAVLLPMRSFLFGLPLALTALFLLWRSFERGPDSCRRELLVAALLIGLLPLVNAHACVMTAWCGLGLALAFLRGNGKDWLSLLEAFALPMALLAAPQLWWTQQQTATSVTFVRFQAGWMAEAKNAGEWIGYWLRNGGAWLPAGLGCWLIAPPRMKKMTAPFLGLLVLGNLLVFQPLAYDNVKFFVFSNLAIAALVSAFCGRLWSASPKWLALIAPLTVALAASGVLSIWRELKIEWAIVDWEGVRFAEIAREHSPPRAVFLSGSELTHPILVLTGRPLVLGYHGWVTNLGIPMGQRIEEVREIFEGGPNAAALLEKYRVGYVVVGPPERREFPKLNEAFIEARAVNRWKTEHYTLYELGVTPPTKPPGE